MINKENLTLKEKCWKVYERGSSLRDIYYSNRYYGETKGKAVWKFCKESFLKFVDAVAIRSKKDDCYIYNFNGKTIIGSISSITSKLKEIERKNEIDSLSDIELFYIQDSRNYDGNSVVWWAKDGRGYTSDINKAWVLSGSEIKSQPWRPIEVFHKCVDVDKIIKNHVDMQDLRKIYK